MQAAASRCAFDRHQHDGSISANYVLANLVDDHTILMRSPSDIGWHAGETFRDVARGVSIQIDAVAADASTARIVV
jgi:hypothetical protein